MTRKDTNVIGRREELSLLRDLIAPPHKESHVLLLLGDPGLGKTVLLAEAAREAKAAGMRVLATTGRESEQDLAFAGLHQLLRQVLDRVGRLATRQAEALRGAFGLSDDPAPPDALLTGIAVLTLLSELSDERPLLVTADDTQWLDRASLDALAFAARRLESEQLVLLAGARGGVPPAGFERDLPQLLLRPLTRPDAGLLLDAQPRPPHGRLREQVLTQAVGNPLALIELSRVIATDPDAGRRWTAEPLPLTGQLTALMAAQYVTLPPAARSALLLAAAADSPDLTTAIPGLSADALAPAEAAGLIRLDTPGPRFAHPLTRSAVYHAAPFAERAAAHRQVADALRDQPDRHAWHLAAGALEPDEHLAALLVDSAAQAQRRGGYAAAATALERAARLSPDPTVRAGRLVRAATMAMYAGHPRWVGELSAQVATLTDEPALLAEASLRAGWALAVTTRFAGSLGFLLPVAEAAVDEDPVLTLDALATATTPAYNSGAPEHREKILRIAERVPPQEDEIGRLWALAGCDPVRNRARALAMFARAWTDPLAEPGARPELDLPLARMVVLGGTAWVLDETAEAIRLLGAAMDHLRRSPTSGANATVAQALALALYESGSWTEARAALDEAYGLAAEGGLENVVVGAPVLRATLLALRGDTEEARAAVQRAVHGIDLPNCRSLQVRTHYALGAAALAEGDHAAAYDRFRAVYTRQPEPEPLHFHASDYYLADPAGDRWPFERAQVRLDYAEWLRRRRRAVEARPLLAAALEVFERLGTRPWTDRTRAELRAAGVTPASPPAGSADSLAELTPQQLQIARLAAAGLTNREIGERIFLSPRTVGFHLYRIFPKLGITSRAQLRDALPEPGE